MTPIKRPDSPTSIEQAHKMIDAPPTAPAETISRTSSTGYYVDDPANKEAARQRRKPSGASTKRPRSSCCLFHRDKSASNPRCKSGWVCVVTEFWTTLRHGEVIRLIVERRASDRSVRIEPRAVKRWPKPHPLLMRSRTEAREFIRKRGLLVKLRQALFRPNPKS